MHVEVEAKALGVTRTRWKYVQGRLRIVHCETVWDSFCLPGSSAFLRLRFCRAGRVVVASGMHVSSVLVVVGVGAGVGAEGFDGGVVVLLFVFDGIAVHGGCVFCADWIRGEIVAGLCFGALYACTQASKSAWKLTRKFWRG